MPPAERFASLDALRGLAALTVGILHSLIILPIFWSVYQANAPLALSVAWLAYSPLHLFWGGQEAVLFFFILSGLVLALPYVAGQPPRYLPYLLKRFFRLYVPALVVLLAGVGMMAWVASPARPGLSENIARYWLAPPTAGLVLSHLGLQRAPNLIVPPMWSLVYELRMSLIFPLIMVPVMRLSGAACLLLALAIYAACSWALRFPGPWTTWLETGHYLPFFLLGALLARHRATLVGRVQSLNSRERLGCWCLALLMLNGRWQLPHTPLASEFSIGLGGALLIAMVLGSAHARALLEHPSFQFLGRISFSFYLVNVVVVFSLVHGLPGLPLPWAAALALPLTLLVATSSYQLFERPSQRLGRRLASRLERSTGAY